MTSSSKDGEHCPDHEKGAPDGGLHQQRAVEQLADTAAKGDCDVPDDPGIAELAAGLAQAAHHLPEKQ